MSERQGTFDFPEEEIEISFEFHNGKCSCGYIYEFKKVNIAIEMIVKCPQCGKGIYVSKKK